MDETPPVIGRTWIAFDECGNSTYTTQLVTILPDSEPPAFAGIPANIEVDCSNIPEPAIVSATDNCDNSVSVIMTETADNSVCSNVITRTWSATGRQW